MKKLGIVIFLTALFSIQNALAQHSGHLKLSDPYPMAGKTISLTYDVEGTPFAGKDSVTGKVYFLDYKDFPVSDLALIHECSLLKSTFIIPSNARAFFVNLNKGDIVDNNNGEGYIYLVYKNKQPVPGAYASEAIILSGNAGMALAKIKPNQAKGFALYKKDFELHPEIAKYYSETYYYQLTSSTNPADSAVVNKRIAELERLPAEKDVMSAYSLLIALRKYTAIDSLGKIIKARFPDGTLAQTAIYETFIRTRSLATCDSLFTVLFQKYKATPESDASYESI